MLRMCQYPKTFGVKTSWLQKWELLTLDHSYSISIPSKRMYKCIANLLIHCPITFFNVQNPTTVSCTNPCTELFSSQMFPDINYFIWKLPKRQHKSVNTHLSSCCTEVRLTVLTVQTLWRVHNFTALSHPPDICKLTEDNEVQHVWKHLLDRSL